MARTNQEVTDLYQRHVDMVYRLCFTYLKNRADTEDAVQNTFIKLIHSNKVFDSVEHEKAWLIVTASNTCKDALRKSSATDQPLEVVQAVLAAPETGHNDVLEAILKLPELYRELVYLTYYEGYTSAELSEMLGRPASTIRNQLRDARNQLKEELGGDFYAE